MIALGPLVVAATLRLPPVNQLEYADAWFYSAYAWVPKHHFAVFELNYFAVRFPAILSIGIFERVFGTQEGYIVLRWLLASASGVALYLGVRRFASAWVAAGAVVLLYVNPFFSRMLLWDYASFVTVAAGVVGFSLWWWTDGRRPAWSAAPGAALAVAAYANVIVATALFVLVVVEIVAAVRERAGRAGYLGRRLLFAASSAVAVLLVGYLSYLRFAAVGIDDLIRPTVDFLLSNEENSALYQRPISEWLYHELRVWAPIVTSVALVAAMGSRITGMGLTARIVQVCIGYTAFLWLYRFAVTSSVVETWWAYNIVVIVVAPALGVLLFELERSAAGGRRRVLAAVAGSVLAAVVIRSVEGPVEDGYEHLATSAEALFAVVAISIGAAILLAIRVDAVRTTALVALFVVLPFLSWAPSVFDGRGTTGVFSENIDLEWDTYAAGKEFAELVRDYDTPRSRVYTWYPHPLGAESIGWTTLPHLGTTVHQLGVDSPMNALQPLGRARLLQPDAAHVLVMSTDPEDLPAARAALNGAGFSHRVVRSGSLAEGRLRYQLLTLTAKPPG